MAFDPVTFNVKDAASANKSMVAYSDGTKNAFAQALLDSAGALISPATSGKQDTGNTSLATIATNTTGAATAAAQSTGNTSLATIATNTTGAATAANQVTGNTSLASIATNTGRIPAQGAALAAASTPVALATDQVSTLATAANQVTANTALTTIGTNTGTTATGIGAPADSAASTDTGTFSLIALIKRGLQNWATLLARTPALGAALAAASTPVVLASDHGALPLPTGAATSANQSTGNTSIANVDTNLGAKADSAASTDTGTFSLIALLKRALQSLTTIGTNTTGLATASNQSTGNTSLASLVTNTTALATASGQSSLITEVGKLYQPRRVAATYNSGSTMTRPANTTAYSFGDMVGSDASTASNNKVWVVPFCRSNDTPGMITGATLFKSSTGITNTAFRIYLFKNTFTIAQNDNAAFILPDMNDALGILTGSIDEVCANGAYGHFVPKTGSAIPAIPASGTMNIFAVIEAVDAYTPVSGESFSMQLHGFA